MLQELKEDAMIHGYSSQLIGNETLDMPLQAKHTDRTSWFIRATPDALAIGCRGVLVELKSKLNNRENIAIELKPLECYKQKTEDIFIVAETILDGGLKSAKVIHAKDIKITWIHIPNRADNLHKLEELEQKYPDANIRELDTTAGGAGTIYTLIGPQTFKKWMSWDRFRDTIILRKNDDWFASRVMGRTNNFGEFYG